MAPGVPFQRPELFHEVQCKVFCCLNSPVYDPTYQANLLKQIEAASDEQLDAIAGIVDHYIEEQRRENPLKFFEPNGKIEEVINAVGDNEKKFIYVLAAANSVGKSCAAINVLGNIIWGGQNSYFKGKRFREWKYPKKAWYISEHSTLKDFICGVDEATESEISKWFPRNRFTFVKAGLEYYSRLTTDNGWSISFKTFDQDVKQFESDKIGVCIEENERVLLADGGLKRIGDVEVGDRVVAFGSKFVHGRNAVRGLSCPRAQNVNTVTGKVVHKNRELVRIVGRGGMSVRCTPEHRFFIKGKGWTEAKNISRGDRIATPEITTDGLAGLAVWQARMLGLLIGDGYLGGKLVHWTCFNEELLDDVKKWLPAGYHLTRKKRQQFNISQDDYQAGHSPNAVRDLMVSTGLWGKLAYQKFVPRVVFSSPRNIRIEFLRYLYATDGWFSGHTIGYGSTSKQLCDDLVLLLRSLNIRSTVHFKKSQMPGRWRDQWFVCINRRSDVIRFSNNIIVPSKRDARCMVYEKAKRGFGAHPLDKETSRQIRKTRRYTFVKSVEPDGVGTVVDIQTDPNHNFIVNGFLSHNCIFDEPPPENIFNACLARLTLGGIIIMPMTPLTHAAWVQDRLVDKATEDSDIFVLFADIESNCALHGIRGRLDHDHIQRIVGQYDQDEVDARAHGKFTHLRGIVYKSIHPAKHRHVMPPESFIQKSDDPTAPIYKIFCVLDPHDRKPPMIGWFAVDQWGHSFQVDEFPDTQHYEPFHLIKNFKLTTEQVCRAIEEKEKMNGWDGSKIKRIIDPNYGRRPMQSVGKTVQEYIAYLGRTVLHYPLYFDPNVNDNVDAGHKLVRDLLYVNADGETNLRFSETHGANIWYHMTHYTYKDFTGKRAESDGLGERVAEKFKDGADVVRYFAAYRAKPIVPEAPKEPQSYDEVVDKLIEKHVQQKSPNKGIW